MQKQFIHVTTYCCKLVYGLLKWDLFHHLALSSALFAFCETYTFPQCNHKWWQRRTELECCYFPKYLHMMTRLRKRKGEEHCNHKRNVQTPIKILISDIKTLKTTFLLLPTSRCESWNIITKVNQYILMWTVFILPLKKEKNWRK